MEDKETRPIINKSESTPLTHDRQSDGTDRGKQPKIPRSRLRFFSDSARSFLNSKPAVFFTNEGPLLNYIGFTFHQFPPSAASTSMHPLTWNFLDGVQAWGTSARKLLGYTPHQKQAKWMGGLYALDGLGLLLFSCPPWICRDETGALSTIGAGWTFAVAMMVDFIDSGVELWNHQQRLSFEGWLKDSIDEVLYLQKKLEERKDEEFPDQEQLERRRNILLGLIQVRCLANTLPEERGFVTAQVNRLNEIDNGLTRKLLPDKTRVNTDEDLKINIQIQAHLEQTYNSSLLNFFVRGTSFIGMSLVAAGGVPLNLQHYWASEEVGEFGFKCTAVVAVYYSLRLMTMLIQKLRSACATSQQGEFGLEERDEETIAQLGAKLLRPPENKSVASETRFPSPQNFVPSEV